MSTTEAQLCINCKHLLVRQGRDDRFGPATARFHWEHAACGATGRISLVTGELVEMILADERRRKMSDVTCPDYQES